MIFYLKVFILSSEVSPLSSEGWEWGGGEKESLNEWIPVPPTKEGTPELMPMERQYSGWREGFLTAQVNLKMMLRSE